MKKFFRSFLSRFVGPGMGLALTLLATQVARADFVVTLTQQGTNVVALGTGAIDLTGLSFAGIVPLGAGLAPDGSVVLVGPVSLTNTDFYIGKFSGPTSFGTGSGTDASSGSGDEVGIILGSLDVPVGYVSGSPLSDTSTWDNATFSSLGVTPGTYEWTWGTGPNQKFVLDVQVVPEPSLFVPILVILFGWVGLSVARSHRGGRNTFREAQ